MSSVIVSSSALGGGLSRRQLLALGLAGAAGSLLASCAPTSGSVASAPTQIPAAQASPSVQGASAASSAVAGGSDWNALVQAAQKEGTVVLKGPPTAAVRTDLPTAFKQAFGIDMQYTGGPSGDTATQLAQERQAGLYSTDVILAGSDSMYGPIYAGKMLDPLLPQLVLADALDTSHWPNGTFWFADPGQNVILRLNNYVETSLYLNTDAVKPEDITSWQDLLKPQLTGKLSTYDPTVSGAGLSTAAYLGNALGDDFVKSLYVDQKPATSRDHRQIADWLARGTYPVAIALRDVEYEQVKSDGFPVTVIKNPPDAPGGVTAGFGLLAILNQPPHPNAAKVLVNWLTSRDGMDAWSKAQIIPPIRSDLDTSPYPAAELIDPSVTTYFDSYAWDYVLKDRQTMMTHLQQLLQS